MRKKSNKTKTKIFIVFPLVYHIECIPDDIRISIDCEILLIQWQKRQKRNERRKSGISSIFIHQ